MFSSGKTWLEELALLVLPVYLVEATMCLEKSQQWPHLIIPKKGPIHISPANRFVIPICAPRFLVDLSVFPEKRGRIYKKGEFTNRFAGDM